MTIRLRTLDSPLLKTLEEVAIAKPTSIIEGVWQSERSDQEDLLVNINIPLGSQELGRIVIEGLGFSVGPCLLYEFASLK